MLSTNRHDPSPRRALARLRLGAAVLFLAFLSATLAAPSVHAIDFLDPESESGRAPSTAAGSADFPSQLDRAVEEIRRQLPYSPACQAYFLELGVDLDAWLEPGMPPFVVARRLRVPGKRRDRVCGAAQAHPPFEHVFVDTDCFRHPRPCELASLILHEIGHLARRDTRDREPRDFFRACRLSACVDPARFD